MGEDSKDTESLDPKSLAIGQRVAEVVGGQSERSFAQRAGVGQTSLNSIIRGKTKPALETLVAIARAGGVTVDWLATGEGPMRRGGDRPPGMADDEVVYRGPVVDEVAETALRFIVERALDHADRAEERPPNHEIARVIVQLCRMEIEARSKSTSLSVHALVKALDGLRGC